jgi:probable phosphoglycerate mutase
MTTSDSTLNTQHLIIHTDGGSRSNPGPAATGVVVLSNNEVIYEHGTYLGVATNNEAEYSAVVEALKWVSSNYTETVPQLTFKLDSQLVVEQLNRHWKIKEPRLQQFANQIWDLINARHLMATFSYIPRAQNACADRQVNLTLDNQA